MLINFMANMDIQSKTKKIQDIIKRFSSKIAIIGKKKTDILKADKQQEDRDALAHAKEKIKNL